LTPDEIFAPEDARAERAGLAGLGPVFAAALERPARARGDDAALFSRIGIVAERAVAVLIGEPVVDDEIVRREVERDRLAGDWSAVARA